jgi:hypothetical protein
MVQKIWSGFTKYIRQQCKKDRITDSIWFGVFAKKKEDSDEAKSEESTKYKLFLDSSTCFPNMKSVGTKLDELPANPDILQININSIAQICGCTLD